MSAVRRRRHGARHGAQAPAGTANAIRIAVAIVVWGAGAAWVGAGGPPPPTEQPEIYTHLEFPTQANVFTVRGRLQYVRPDSVDLVRVQSATARVRRVEALVNAEAIVLHPFAAEPERYRAPVPRGAPLQWSYEAELASKSPHASGAGWSCVWLGSLLLAPQLPGTDTPAVDKILFGTRFLGTGVVVAPWSQSGGLFRPATLADLTDAFVAGGDFRVRTLAVAASACTLQVAVGGTLAVADSIWFARLTQDLGPHLPKDGRALACVVPTAGEPALRRARRSWLLEWPAERSTPPTADFYPGVAASSPRP